MAGHSVATTELSALFSTEQCWGADLFNLYSEHILRRLEESNDGVTINGVCINNIRYAYDTALIADSEEGLQRLLDLVLDASSDEGMEINCKKTFCMVVSKERQPPTCNLICNGTGIEQVNSFNYLGSMLTSDGRCEKEIRRRIGMAKTSFNQMSPVLKDRKLSIPLKVRLLKCFIWSVLLYGCESWTLSAALTRNIEDTEMWFYRRMLRVSYTAHETNISVLQRMGQERQLLRTIKERQTRFTGHIIRKGELEDLILAGKVQAKKARGGQRLLFLNQVMENTGLISPRTIWNAARNRTLKIKTSWVVKGRIDQGTKERVRSTKMMHMHVKDVHGVVQQEVVLMFIRFDCGKLNWVLLVYSLNCANNM